MPRGWPRWRIDTDPAGVAPFGPDRCWCAEPEGYRTRQEHQEGRAAHGRSPCTIPLGVQSDGRDGGIILQEMTAPEEVPAAASVARVARAPPAVRERRLDAPGGCMAALRWAEISLDALPNIPMLCS